MSLRVEFLKMAPVIKTYHGAFLECMFCFISIATWKVDVETNILSTV